MAEHCFSMSCTHPGSSEMSTELQVGKIEKNISNAIT